MLIEINIIYNYDTSISKNNGFKTKSRVRNLGIYLNLTLK